MIDQAFLDSNSLIYAFTRAGAKTERAQALVSSGGIVSVQVLNEVANTLRRKFDVPWLRIGQIVDEVLIHCPHPKVVSLQTHQRALGICERYRYAFHDGLIIASALEGGCRVLHTEDMQHGQEIDGVRIVNPFLGL